MSLLDRILVVDPAMRASAKVALNSKYFMLAPQAPKDPRELPPLNIADGVSMHEYETKQKKKEDAAAKASPPSAMGAGVPPGGTMPGMAVPPGGMMPGMGPGYGMAPIMSHYGGYGQHGQPLAMGMPAGQGQAGPHPTIMGGYGGMGLSQGMAGYQQQQSQPLAPPKNSNSNNGGVGKRRAGGRGDGQGQGGGKNTKKGRK